MTLNEFRELTKDLPGGLVICVRRGSGITANIKATPRERRVGQVKVKSLLIEENSPQNLPY